MNQNTKIKFAVVGQGHIGKRHAEMIRRNANCELIAVCDVASKESLGLENITEKFSQKKYHTVSEIFFLTSSLNSILFHSAHYSDFSSQISIT